MLLATHGVNETVRAYGEKVQPIGVAIGRYVLMPDHLHLFVRITGGSSLANAVKLLKQEITKTIRILNPDVRVWQPGFFDHLLRNDESYREKWAYVEQNPVRAGLAVNAELWPYQGEIVVIDRV